MKYTQVLVTVIAVSLGIVHGVPVKLTEAAGTSGGHHGKGPASPPTPEAHVSSSSTGNTFYPAGHATLVRSIQAPQRWHDILRNEIRTGVDQAFQSLSDQGKLPPLGQGQHSNPAPPAVSNSAHQKLSNPSRSYQLPVIHGGPRSSQPQPSTQATGSSKLYHIGETHRFNNGGVLTRFEQVGSSISRNPGRLQQPIPNSAVLQQVLHSQSQQQRGHNRVTGRWYSVLGQGNSIQGLHRSGQGARNDLQHHQSQGHNKVVHPGMISQIQGSRVIEKRPQEGNSAEQLSPHKAPRLDDSPPTTAQLLPLVGKKPKTWTIEDHHREMQRAAVSASLNTNLELGPMAEHPVEVQPPPRKLSTKLGLGRSISPSKSHSTE